MGSNSSFELFSGILVDQLIGDPKQLPHPVNFVAALARIVESYTRPPADSEREFYLTGTLMAFTTVASTVLAAELLSKLGPGFRILLMGTALASKSLGQAANHVEDELFAGEKNGDLTEARKALSNYVGRDTSLLKEDGIARATIETVAENTCDGYVAPLFWGAVGTLVGHGPALMWGYKAINTLDSMYGYKDDENIFYGRTAAKMDDMATYLPARLTAASAIAGAFLIGENTEGAIEAVALDHNKHESPNAGWPESAFAGALNIELGGPATYHGTKVDHPVINEGTNTAKRTDISRAKRLMYATVAVSSIVLVGLSFLARKK